MSNKPNTVYLCMEYFLDTKKEKRHLYKPMPKDYKHLKDLLQKIKKLHIEVNGSEPTPDEEYENWQLIIRNIPTWWQDKPIPTLHGNMTSWLPEAVKNIEQEQLNLNGII